MSAEALVLQYEREFEPEHYGLMASVSLGVVNRRCCAMKKLIAETSSTVGTKP
jgi:hypothetical protein